MVGPSRHCESLERLKRQKDALKLPGRGTVSESKARDEALRVGKNCLGEQQNPAKDVRRYAGSQLKASEIGSRMPRTPVAMADGTNAPLRVKPPCLNSEVTP